jgi:UDP-N-acetylmuramoylalanine--D-glutamate ligase
MIVVMGYGRSGRAAAAQLSRMKVRAAVTDDRELADAPRLPGLRYALGGHPPELLDGASLVIVSPGVPWDHPFLAAARARGIAVSSEVEWAGQLVKGVKVGVTGSNGKSTVTRMLRDILIAADHPAAETANTGDALSNYIGDAAHTHFVLELSTFQLEGMTLPLLNAAVLLNITPDHLDRHPSFEAYAALKRHIFDLLLPGGKAVAPQGLDAGVPALTFGPAPGADLVAGPAKLTYRGVMVLDRAAFPLPGEHNWANAAAAALTALAMGIGLDAVRAALEAFRGLEHRMEAVTGADGLRYINDSKGTNVDAVLAALTGVPAGTTILILGGRDKHGAFETLMGPVGRTCRAVLCIGEAGPAIAERLKGAAVPVTVLKDLEAVFAALPGTAAKGDTVLLSPGCASFDQYANYEERGRHFKALVGRCRAN